VSPGVELRHEIVQLSCRDGFAQSRHQALVMMQVVDGGQLAAEDLVAAIKVAQGRRD
jgi:hypothetical protein